MEIPANKPHTVNSAVALLGAIPANSIEKGTSTLSIVVTNEQTGKPVCDLNYRNLSYEDVVATEKVILGALFAAGDSIIEASKLLAETENTGLAVETVGADSVIA